MKLGLLAVSVALVLCLARPASAGARMAVLVSVQDDADLADNLTELVISQLSRATQNEFVGLSELRHRLAEIEPFARGGLRACVAEPSCLRRVGDVAGANAAVVGFVELTSEKYSIELVSFDLQTAARRAEVHETSPPVVEGLVAGVRRGVAQLLDEERRAQEKAGDEPIAKGPSVLPVPPNPAAPPNAASGTGSVVARVPEEPSSDRGPQTKTVVAYTAAALAVVAFSTAAVTGTIARGSPEGATRAEAQADLERRKDFATATNALVIGGATLTLVAGVTFFWP